MSNVALAHINSFLPTEVVSIPASVLTALVDQVQAFAAKIEALEKRLEESQETLNLNIARDRQRITALEHPPEPEPKPLSKKVVGHLDDIVGALLGRQKACEKSGFKFDFMTFWEVSQLLDLSHRRISQLARIASNDPRFVIGWHPKKRNTKAFRLALTLGKVGYELQKVLGA